MFAHLKYVVLCKPPGQRFFSSIAAFNCESASDAYMEFCKETHPCSFEYMTMCFEKEEERA